MKSDPANPPVRLDKWLWAARFFKTRALAKTAIETGKVLYNNNRAKPSRTVEIDAQLRVSQGFDQKTVIVERLSGQRRSATEAATLYSETVQSIQDRQQNALQRKQMNAGRLTTEGRPTKKQRRQIHQFKDASLDP